MKLLPWPVLRSLGRRRGSLLSVVILGLAVGLVGAMASLVQGVWLRGLPFPEGDRIVMWSTGGAAAAPTSVSDYQALRAALGSVKDSALEDVAALRTFNTVVTDQDLGSRGTTGSYVSPHLFDLLQVKPQLGRGLVAADGLPGAPAVVLLSDRYWHRHFNGDEAVLGREIVVNREVMTVVGVMAPGFQFPFRQDLWSVLRFEGPSWSGTPLFALGKLAPGRSAAAARQQLKILTTGLEADLQAQSSGDLNSRNQSVSLQGSRTVPRDLRLLPFVDAVLDPRVKKALGIMMWAVVGVLLMACLNVANLRLAEAWGRRRELTTRGALGASRSRILGMLLGESAVLAAGGAVVGWVLAWGLTTLAGKALVTGGPLRSAFWVDVRMDLRVTAVAAGAAVLALLVGGLLPTLSKASQQSLSGSEGSARRSAWAGRGLVALQVAGTLVFLLGAGLTIRSALGLLERPLGFQQEDLAAVRISTFQADHDTEEKRRAFVSQLEGNLLEGPEVAAATYASAVPWQRVPTMSVALGKAVGTDLALADLPRAAVLSVMPSFFETLGTVLLEGRNLNRGDLEAEDPPLMVSASFVHRHFGPSSLSEPSLGRSPLGRSSLGQSPLGQTVELRSSSGGSGTNVQGTIVGVFADLGLDRQDAPFAEELIVRPFSFAASGGGFALLRGAGEIGGLSRAVDGAVARTDLLVAAQGFETMEETLAVSTWVERRLAQIFGVFACAALFLSMGGLYAVLAVAVRSRFKEMGIRAALGALPGDLRRLVLRAATGTLLAGIALGSLAAAFGGRALRPFLYRVEPWDPAVLAAIGGVLFVSGLLASLAPAHLASQADPAQVLRGE